MIMLVSAAVSATDTFRTPRTWRMFIFWAGARTGSRLFFVAATSDE
jgi:hypothetical protein